MRERKKVKIYKTTILFIILDLIAAWCFFMMYGPWDKVRNMYVNTAMKPMHHQYFANIFYNQKTIDKTHHHKQFHKIPLFCVHYNIFIVLFKQFTS